MNEKQILMTLRLPGIKVHGKPHTQRLPVYTLDHSGCACRESDISRIPISDEFVLRRGDMCGWWKALALTQPEDEYPVQDIIILNFKFDGTPGELAGLLGQKEPSTMGAWELLAQAFTDE